ncbi:hypothetical protein K469DRAFT_712260 [Zopfia rhizophila CBS 207.26]|uniref:Uncharacterized protein n=1 Tax=Zopfia rhizophila CBS 207.26 TaxID=1314779 RepID=A0A6A6ERZ6_9PEZI|nr:hypothetical protein K469DRAFT_712260 [Zopfia rhizophila CBS 207.26]
MRTQWRRPPLPTPKPLDPLPEGTQTILREGDSAVAYHIPITPLTHTTTISIPKDSTWTSGLHWHTTHTEYLRLLHGSIYLRLNNEVKILSAGDAEEGGDVTVRVDKGVRHNWGRAQQHLQRVELGVPLHRMKPSPRELDEEVVVEEWTEPRDGEKALFFWNLNNLLLYPDKAPDPRPGRVLRRALGKWWMSLQLFIIFLELDNLPVLLDLGSFFGEQFEGQEWIQGIGMWFAHVGEWALTGFVLLFAGFVGRLVGLQAVSEGRTPKELWEDWVGIKEAKKVK